ncbi:MAG: M20/M25/M40 family metallo-hydrolase [Lentisphaerae bacterium]|nr:M20/M25/M40 family metallo-hydrolase [Lentisphaerota bacterium]
MNHEEFLQMLSSLLKTHSPSGDEEEINHILIPLFEQTCDKTWKDEAGNIIGVVRGKGGHQPVRVLAHKDEIGAIVKRIDPDGRLVLTALGASAPWRYGEGPMDVLAVNQVLTGILSVGANHISEESKTVYQALFSKPLTWDMVRLDLKIQKEQLLKLGVRVGTRVVVSRSRKQLTQIGDFVAGWALDDKGAIAILLQVMQALKSQDGNLPQDVYFVASGGEEIGISGGAFAARTLPGDVLIALEVAPVAEEYDIKNSAQPVLIYKDRQSIYHKQTTDTLSHLAEELGFGFQAAVVSAFSSDASYANSYGYTGKAVCLCFPTENTHGYEITNLEAMENTAKLLTAYLTNISNE